MKGSSSSRLRHTVTPVVTVALLLAAPFLLVGCEWTSFFVDPKPVRSTDFAMGTVVSISAYGPKAEAGVNAAMDRLREIDALMSATCKESDVSRVNASAGIAPVPVSAETLHVVEKALEYGALTDGRFDITIGPIVKAWGIGTDHARIPSAAEIQGLKKSVNYDDVVVDHESRTVFLSQPGMALDLGAIAKGYAADEASSILRDHGVSSAIVDVGGNLIAIGHRPDKGKWKMGIRDPRGDLQEAAASIEIADMSIVTSGDYERYFIEDGTRYHHILDPRTGYPATTGIMSATIVAPKSLDADALSTSVFLLGAKLGLALVESLPDTECVIITESREIITSSGLTGKIMPNSSKYHL